MGLKLILSKFDISLNDIKQKEPDIDKVTAVIALVQILHDLDYDIKLVIDNGYKIRSSKLVWEVTSVIQEEKCGGLVIKSTMSLNDLFEYKMNVLKECIVAPADVPFNNQDWVCFVGFYCILSENYLEPAITQVLMQEKIEYLPYFMVAEEQIAELRSHV